MSSGINSLLGKPNDFFINLGDHSFFGENAFIKDVVIQTRMPEFIDVSSIFDEERHFMVGKSHPVDITIHAVAPDIALMFQATSKISLKQVKDCSIDELIYAVREKIRRGEL
jgi:hypothetical protein